MPASSPITISVDLHVQPGKLEPFLVAINANASGAFENEPGCLYFDVSRDTEDELHFTLFEIFADEEAFELHKRSAHFAAWDAAAGDLLIEGGRTRTIARRVYHYSEGDA